MTEAPVPTAAQTPYQVTVQHGGNGVLIQVTGGGSCQGGIDTESVVAFLSALDPDQLEKDALDGLGMLDGDGETSFTKALLNRLVTIAKGEW